MSSKHGSSVNVYEKCDKEGFKLVGNFVSARKVGKFLGISGSTVMKYLKSFPLRGGRQEPTYLKTNINF